MTPTKDEVKYLGIDCAKASFETNLEGVLETRNWINDPDGIHRFVAWIRKQPGPVHALIEPSGGYERNLLRSLYAHGLRVSRVDAYRVRHFAKSEGLRAKSDPIDARLLVRFGREKRPSPWEPTDQAFDELRQRVSRRRHIADMITLEKTRLEQAEGFTRKDILSFIRLLEKEARIEEHILEHLRSHPKLYRTYQRLKQPKGIGPVTAYTVLAFLPELGLISDKRAASLAGLAPYTQNSGTHQGKAFVQGGRKELRKPLHMAAKVAIQHNPILKCFYQTLVQKGKHPKAATTAVMRKMIVLMNRIAANHNFCLQT